MADFRSDIARFMRTSNMAALSFEGERAMDFRWVQFVWREKLVTKRVRFGDKSGTMTLPADDFYSPGNLGGEQRQFTWDRAHPIYAVDVLRPGLKRGPRPDTGPIATPTRASPTSPSYFGTNVRDSRMLRILDKPGAQFCPHALQKDTIRVESKAHFDTFLVLNGRICAKVSWQVVHEWNEGDRPACDPNHPSRKAEGFVDPPQVYSASDPDISGASPNDAQMRVLKYTHPGQEVLR